MKGDGPQARSATMATTDASLRHRLNIPDWLAWLALFAVHFLVLRRLGPLLPPRAASAAHVLGCWLLLCGPVLAHKASDSYLKIGLQGAQVSGQWDIALRDIDFALGLDADGNGEITWGELRARHGDIAAYALARLAVDAVIMEFA